MIKDSRWNDYLLLESLIDVRLRITVTPIAEAKKELCLNVGIGCCLRRSW